MTRLSSTKREQLYKAEAAKARAAGLGPLPICNICGFAIDGTRQRWHVSHDPVKARWLNGAVTGIAHARCNLDHAYTVDTPKFHKSNRVRQKYIGAKVRKGRPMIGTFDSNVKIPMTRGRPINRQTGREF
jgi:hypothetical protein